MQDGHKFRWIIEGLDETVAYTRDFSRELDTG